MRTLRQRRVHSTSAKFAVVTHHKGHGEPTGMALAQARHTIPCVVPACCMGMHRSQFTRVTNVHNSVRETNMAGISRRYTIESGCARQQLDQLCLGSINRINPGTCKTRLNALTSNPHWRGAARPANVICAKGSCLSARVSDMYKLTA